MQNVKCGGNHGPVQHVLIGGNCYSMKLFQCGSNHGPGQAVWCGGKHGPVNSVAIT